MIARPFGQHPAIAAVCGWSTRPVVDQGLALLAGGGHEGTTGEVLVVQGLDEGANDSGWPAPPAGEAWSPARPCPSAAGTSPSRSMSMTCRCGYCGSTGAGDWRPLTT
jgi:hypothetical protein